MKRTVTPLYSNIGMRISQLRRKKKLTQAQLSEKLNITVKHLSECERGISSLTLDKLVLVCEILDTDMEYLIRGNDLTGHSVAIPPYIMECLKSNDIGQRKLIQDYFQMFLRLQKK